MRTNALLTRLLVANSSSNSVILFGNAVALSLARHFVKRLRSRAVLRVGKRRGLFNGKGNATYLPAIGNFDKFFHEYLIASL